MYPQFAGIIMAAIHRKVQPESEIQSNQNLLKVSIEYYSLVSVSLLYLHEHIFFYVGCKIQMSLVIIFVNVTPAFCGYKSAFCGKKYENVRISIKTGCITLNYEIFLH